MEPNPTAITGTEDQGNLATPHQALVQFYDAFNRRDMTAMAENWAQTDDVAMDNPLGGITRGWPEIRAVYDKIFKGKAMVKVEFYDYTIHEYDDVFYAVGRERGRLVTRKNELALAIRTTRVFKRVNGRWRQIHHHGSFDDPKLLKSYQAAVLGQSG